jgi:hypothetical protein
LCDGDAKRRFSKDELLTTITIYWVPGSINSSFSSTTRAGTTRAGDELPQGEGRTAT